MVELIEGARMAIDELIDVLGRTSVECVLELSASLLRCLGTTNIIESPMSGVRLRTRRISRFTDPSMALRWAASAFLDTEESFRKISGYQDLWMLKAKLEEKGVDAKEESWSAPIFWSKFYDSPIVLVKVFSIPCCPRAAANFSGVI